MKLKNFSLNYGSQVLKALSDEARIRILYLLHRNKDMCISDLELILDFTQTENLKTYYLPLRTPGLSLPGNWTNGYSTLSRMKLLIS